MTLDIFSALVTLHAAAYNPNTETLFLEIIMGTCATIGCDINIIPNEKASAIASMNRSTA